MNCSFCGHPLSAHNTKQWDGPVCMWCACGDEFVIVDNPAVFSVWREVGVVAGVAVVTMTAILLAIWWLERMVMPW